MTKIFGAASAGKEAAGKTQSPTPASTPRPEVGEIEKPSTTNIIRRTAQDASLVKSLIPEGSESDTTPYLVGGESSISSSGRPETPSTETSSSKTLPLTSTISSPSALQVSCSNDYVFKKTDVGMSQYTIYSTKNIGGICLEDQRVDRCYAKISLGSIFDFNYEGCSDICSKYNLCDKLV